jgi:phosphonate metabolism protein PhnN/1,5-bisphosphokinase (PRPP-forming)
VWDVALHQASRGTLILVAGPSGAGKDTIIAGAARALAGNERYLFPNRVITRPEGAPAEQHFAVDGETFSAMYEAGAFALAWEAHGLAYGISAAIEAALASGRHVVINVSRRVVGEAKRRFRPTKFVLVVASPAALALRLAARGRETPPQIAARLTSFPSDDEVAAPDLTIVNDGVPEVAIAEFTEFLNSLRR